MLRVAGVLLLPALLLVGCSSTTPAVPKSTTHAASAAVKPAVTEATVREPDESSRTDKKGDDVDFDIRAVHLARVGDLERVTITASQLN